MTRHGGDDIGGTYRVGGDLLGGTNSQGGQHGVPACHGAVDGARIEHVGTDYLESIMVQRKRIRLPGNGGDLMAGGQCLLGEQAAGGPVGSEDCDVHGDSRLWLRQMGNHETPLAMVS